MTGPITMSAADLDASDEAAVLRVLRSGRLALGPESQAFEEALAERIGVRHAVTTSSGTAALHCIVRALGAARGQEVIVPSFTFAASVNAILYEDLRPVFVDCDPYTFQLDPREVAAKITPRTAAVMAVDVFGHPAPLDELETLCQAHDLALIDDSCEALGASWKGRSVGTFGDAAAFAFYPNKQITAGEGGVLVTDDDEIAQVARSLRNQGREAMGTWLDHVRIGFNYRMDEMSAALVRNQFARIDTILDRRASVAAMYHRHLVETVPTVRPPIVHPDATMSWFVYVVTLPRGADRTAIGAHLEKAGIPTRGYFAPIHQQPYIREMFHDLPVLPVSEEAARRTLALPFHGTMTDEQVERVCEALSTALKEHPPPAGDPQADPLEPRQEGPEVRPRPTGGGPC